MDVSIIFVNYNTCSLTIKAIKSVYSFTDRIKFEIIVIDNNSIDDSVLEIKKEFPDVIVIENNQNIGFGRANNVGMKTAIGKYYFLLNTDTYLLNNAIEILFDFMEDKNNKDVAVVGAKLTKPDGSNCVSDAHFPNFKLFIKGSFLKYFYPKDYYRDEDFIPIKRNETIPYETDYVSGADYFIRNEIINRVGDFNKKFFLYAEETELSFRIKKLIPESKCIINPAAKIVHISQGSQDENSSNRKFRLRFIKSMSIYYSLTRNKLSGLLYFAISIKRFYIN